MSRPDFVYVTFIETTPDKLWEALTSNEFTRQYFFNTDIVTDWKVGSTFAYVQNGKTNDEGEILEFDPPKRLSYTFHSLMNETAIKETPSRVTFVLEPFGSVVKLTLTHDNFPQGSVVLGAISNGWPKILSGLKSLLETGKAL
ncbi:SRPBCC family protein [soil metagenome]